MDISKDNFQMLEEKCMIDKPVQCGSYSMSIVYFAAYTAVISLVAESGRLRPSAAACANSGRRGMGRLPRKCKPRGPCRDPVGSRHYYLAKFGENNTKHWQKVQRFLNNNLSIEDGAKECIV